jgi:hypothetical protein
MLWWVLAVFGVTVLVLQWMIFRRQLAFIVAGLLLIVGGGLGIAGIWQSGTNPLEQAVEAIRKQVPGVIPPSAPADAPVGVTPLPEASGATSPLTPPSSVTPESPTNPAPSELPPPQPTSPEPVSPEPISPAPPSSLEPVNPDPATPPSASTPIPERYTLEVNSNAALATVKLERPDGTNVGSHGVPATFENLESGEYRLIVESPGTKGFRGTLSVPQSKTVTVYLEN